jgi:hypothetical protein
MTPISLKQRPPEEVPAVLIGLWAQEYGIKLTPEQMEALTFQVLVSQRIAVESAVATARAQAFEDAANAVENDVNDCERCNYKGDIPDYRGKQLAAAIRSLASQEAGGEANQLPDLIPCWCCGQAKKPSDMEMVKTTEYDNDGESIYRAVLICKHSDPEDNPCLSRIQVDEDKEQAARAALELALPTLTMAIGLLEDHCAPDDIYNEAIAARAACRRARQGE